MKKIFVCVAVFLSIISFSTAHAALSPTELNMLVASGNLTVGSRGSNVVLLQKMLVAETDKDPTIYPSRIISGYFGMLTKAGLARLQAKRGIYPAVGFFGPLTRAALRTIVQAGGVVAPPVVTPSPATSTPNVAAVLADPLPTVPNSDVVVSASAAIYEVALGTVLPKISLEQEDLKLLKTDGSILTIPSLLDQLRDNTSKKNFAAGSTSLAKLKAWGKYFSEAYPIFATMAVRQEDVERHKTMLGWMKYGSQTISSLGSNSTAEQILAIAERYKKTYEANKKNLSEPSFLAGNTPKIRNFPLGLLYDWATPKRALAQALVPLGGTITISDECLTGELLTVSAPVGGSFFLYWPVYLANPYAYNSVKDGSWILGNAVPGPGFCTHSLYDYYWTGEAYISYFGTSL